MQNELLRPSSLLHRPPLIYFVPRRNLVKFSIPYPLLRFLQEFSWLEEKE